MTSSDDLRRTVLDASLALIAQDGLDALSMREVARRAGVSHQAPYHHFGDREGILAAICEEGFEKLKIDMRKAIAKAGADPIDRLTAIGRAYVGFALAHPSHFKLMFRSEFVSHERHEGAQETEESAFDMLVRVTNEVAIDVLGRKDETFAVMAWGLAHGLATLLLEGKLKHHFGDSVRAQRAAVEKALDAHCALLRRR